MHTWSCSKSYSPVHILRDCLCELTDVMVTHERLIKAVKFSLSEDLAFFRVWEEVREDNHHWEGWGEVKGEGEGGSESDRHSTDWQTDRQTDSDTVRDPDTDDCGPKWSVFPFTGYALKCYECTSTESWDKCKPSKDNEKTCPSSANR